MFKLFHPKKETVKGSEKENQTESIKKSETKIKRQKKIYPSREDGGPSTRSKTAREKVMSYAEVLKAPVPKKNAQVNKFNEHKIKEFIKIQQQQAVAISEINTRKANAKRTKDDIQKVKP